MKKILALLLCTALLAVLAIPVMAAPQYEAPFGSPKLGTNDPLWNTAPEFKSNPAVSGDNDPAHFVGRILWDNNFLYVRVVVTDADVYTGGEGDEWMSDNIEFFFGAGKEGENQWRLAPGGRESGRTFEETWNSVEAPGYIMEVKISKDETANSDYKFEAGELISFEIQSANSTSDGNDRPGDGLAILFGSQIPNWGTTDEDNDYNDTVKLVAAPAAVEPAPMPTVDVLPDAPAPEPAQTAAAPAPRTADPIAIFAIGSIISAAGVVIARRKR